MCSKPDLDNLTKSFLDALESILFKDDKMVVSMNNVSKEYGDKGYIAARLEYSNETN